MNTLKSLGILALAGAVMAGSVAIAQQQQLPRHVAGKIVNVSHEKVKVGNAWQDKVGVTVDSCAAPGKLETVWYAPGTDSSRTALGHLFDEGIMSAHTPDMKQQQMSNGYGVFWVDGNNTIQRTGILGARLDCGTVPAILQQF